ncbi:MAG: hypothetical protein MZV65_21180, partial [Chromatiales bacterium]|nr:hypothetical protein [Chromatiales bacterium]
SYVLLRLTQRHRQLSAPLPQRATGSTRSIQGGLQIPEAVSFDTIHYAGMAVTKIAIILFSCSRIAIKLISGKKVSAAKN